ncbi:MAG: dephospho-CoA kinase [bacterium]
MKKFIVGVTGGIGSGKSTVSRLLKKKGFEIIDADDVAREVVKPGTDMLNKIVQHFGKSMLNPDGTLNRKKLASVVFSNESERIYLEDLLHPEIIATIQRRVVESDEKVIIIVIPLLFESGVYKKCDLVVTVSAPVESCIKRIIERDGIDRKEIQKRIDAQKNDKERISKSDIVIENVNKISDLKKKVEEVVVQIRKLMN